MLDSIGGANGVHFRKFQNKTLRRAAATDIRATRSSFSQLESYKQDSSDVPQKSDRGSINLEIRMAKGLVHHAQFIASQKWHSEGETRWILEESPERTIEAVLNSLGDDGLKKRS
ncbi:hypothetical protein AVEN_175091-2 [Araneus ventricosus]|uniref:Uncharacterized protein n=1 Tax=Araneus ventricosus TaxID=182803 RepID=A0A4Y2RZ41_ARAVE|nr:hypothetical protein AVEN_23382-2 [Araneus ventricosus]GBN81017.1 hypothetical protein AVEN_175091-2 [Araneus ventricosus]